MSGSFHQSPCWQCSGCCNIMAMEGAAVSTYTIIMCCVLTTLLPLLPVVALFYCAEKKVLAITTCSLIVHRLPVPPRYGRAINRANGMTRCTSQQEGLFSTCKTMLSVAQQGQKRGRHNAQEGALRTFACQSFFHSRWNESKVQDVKPFVLELE